MVPQKVPTSQERKLLIKYLTQWETLVLLQLQKRQYTISNLKPFANTKAICYPQKHQNQNDEKVY